MPWLIRGLRDGLVTTRYPRRPDGYPASWHGAVEVSPTGATRRGPTVAGICPTGAIAAGDGQVRLDRGRCIVCGACVRAYPDLFRFTAEVELAGLTRRALVVPSCDGTDAEIAAVRVALGRRVAALRRSVHVRHVDAGSDGAEEAEILALTNPVYDVHRLGIFLTASPRHADLLLVTGVGAAGMAGPLAETRRQMPDPVVVIAVGVDALSGGLLAGGSPHGSGVGDQLDVDVWVPGSPPSPFTLLHAILLALGRVPPRARTAEVTP